MKSKKSIEESNFWLSSFPEKYHSCMVLVKRWQWRVEKLKVLCMPGTVRMLPPATVSCLLGFRILFGNTPPTVLCRFLLIIFSEILGNIRRWFWRSTESFSGKSMVYDWNTTLHGVHNKYKQAWAELCNVQQRLMLV